MSKLAASAFLLVAAAALCAKASDLLDLKDTFVESAEKTRRIDAVSPNSGSAAGGTRLHISGTGFATEFYSGSNTVYIGSSSSSWVQYVTSSTIPIHKLRCPEQMRRC